MHCPFLEMAGAAKVARRNQRFRFRGKTCRLLNNRGNGIVASMVGLAMAGALAGALAQTFAGAAKWSQRISGKGELEDIKTSFFRMPRVNCEASLYNPGTTQTIDACNSNPGGYLKLYVGKDHLVIDLPRGTAVGDYTKISHYEFRAHCPDPNGQSRQLAIEYRDTLSSATTDWKYLFQENTVCSYIFDKSATTNTCGKGQYVSGLEIDGRVKCSDLPATGGTAIPTCSANQYLTSNSKAAPICKDLPNCGPVRTLAGFDSGGNPICRMTGCYPGQYVKGYQNDGAVICGSLVPIYRCYYTNGTTDQDTFQSKDPNCEGQRLIGGGPYYFAIAP